jgi:ribosome biogenesis protein Tsr3
MKTQPQAAEGAQVKDSSPENCTGADKCQWCTDKIAAAGLVEDPSPPSPLYEAETYMENLGITVIDCTHKPIEQTANFILQQLDTHFGVHELQFHDKDSSTASWSW